MSPKNNSESLFLSHPPTTTWDRLEVSNQNDGLSRSTRPTLSTTSTCTNNKALLRTPPSVAVVAS